VIPKPLSQKTEKLKEPTDAHDQEDFDDDERVAVDVAVHVGRGVVHSQSSTFPPGLNKLGDSDGEENQIDNLDE